jgi:3D (Asp-Asp-Asp) domain-containing protein
MTTTGYAQWLDAYIPDFKVNDDNLNSYQTNSDIGVDSSGNFVIVWRDVRNNPGNQLPPTVYCQRYNKDGLTLGNNFMIGHDTAQGVRVNVLIDGRFIVTWGKSYENYTKLEIYFQRFSKNGQPLNIPTRIIDTSYNTSNTSLSGVSIVSDMSGKFILTWSHFSIGDSTRVYFQRYDSTGSRIGTPQRVNEANSNVEIPKIAINNDGSFVIVWQDNRNNITFNKYDIYMQRYDANANKIGNNIKVNDDTNTMIDQLGADVGTDANGYTVVVWNDQRLFNPYSNIFYQLYDINGNAIGANRRADVNAVFAETGIPKTQMRIDKKFYINWVDESYAGKKQVFGRRFDWNGDPIGNPYMIPSSSPGNSEQSENTLYLLNDRVYTSWTDNRNGGTVNYDIYCNVRGFQNPDTVIGIHNTTEFAKGYKLYPAYPNPFNPETNIMYTIAKRSFVTIIIYDITGKNVALLLNDFRAPGDYRILWKANTLPSGIYFIEIRTNTGYREVQKALLIK